MPSIIGPHVAAGCHLEWQGEEGEQWRWRFDGETGHEEYGDVIYNETSGVVAVSLSPDEVALLLANENEDHPAWSSIAAKVRAAGG